MNETKIPVSEIECILQEYLENIEDRKELIELHNFIFSNSSGLADIMGFKRVLKVEDVDWTE